MYTIYKITSPSGKCYIGLTSLKLRDRWDAHCTRAFRRLRKHPFYAAIRKYGKAAFTVEILATAEDLAAAKLAEVRLIAKYRCCDRQYGYNISSGGDYDATAGKEAMRKLRMDPEYDAAYRSALSKGIRAARAPESYTAFIAGAKRWRVENPRQSYENGRRAVRVATKKAGYEWSGVPGKLPNTVATYGRLWIPSEKVRWARHRYFTKRHVRAKWVQLDGAQRKKLGRLIGAGQKAAFIANPARKAEVTEQLKAARANVDRKKQAAAASAGQKRYWVELRKDPERYAEYMERRRATLIATLKAKSDLRRRERGAQKPVHDSDT